MDADVAIRRRPLPAPRCSARLEATVDPEWHMYSLTTPPGPIPTTIKPDDSPAIEKVHYFRAAAGPQVRPEFQCRYRDLRRHADFPRAHRAEERSAAGPVTITFEPRYQTCSGTSCIPPRTRAGQRDSEYCGRGACCRDHHSRRLYRGQSRPRRTPAAAVSHGSLRRMRAASAAFSRSPSDSAWPPSSRPAFSR